MRYEDRISKKLVKLNNRMYEVILQTKSYFFSPPYLTIHRFVDNTGYLEKIYECKSKNNTQILSDIFYDDKKIKEIIISTYPIIPSKVFIDLDNV